MENKTSQIQTYTSTKKEKEEKSPREKSTTSKRIKDKESFRVAVYANLQIIQKELMDNENLAPLSLNPHIYFTKVGPPPFPGHRKILQKVLHVYCLSMHTNFGIYWIAANCCLESPDLNLDQDLKILNSQPLTDEESENPSLEISCLLKHGYTAIAYFFGSQYQYGHLTQKDKSSHAKPCYQKIDFRLWLNRLVVLNFAFSGESTKSNETSKPWLVLKFG